MTNSEQYKKLYKELNRLIKNGFEDSDKAEEMREKMDEVWEKLTKEEIEEVNLYLM